ncbi:hypothetical protein EUGRSUZ_H02355 [Eucalyptus grandis]|uniref:Uncharacterized protein n=2 Tax=Eucalyptus grandis TaxID=71139 RepID=A0ACC3JQS4_EUCGR|nr:hypothetical protein EUGRSUZ_H02355 [Eucalyptus grandis]
MQPLGKFFCNFCSCSSDHANFLGLDAWVHHERTFPIKCFLFLHCTCCLFNQTHCRPNRKFVFSVVNISFPFSGAGSSDLSPHSLTLWSGLLAVISVNVVIGFYIYLAMKEPSDKHEPDPAFLAQARASIQKPIESTEGPSQPREKDE